MATKSRPNWKVLDTLLPVLEKEGWSLAQIAEDWGMSLATLEGHLRQEVSMSAPPKHDYPALIVEYDQRLASGESTKAVQADFHARGIHVRTFLNQRSKEHRRTPQAHQNPPEEHRSIPEPPNLWTVHPGTPEPTERMPDKQDTQEHLDTPDESDIAEVHPSTPEEHHEMSPTDSGVLSGYSGVPARQSHDIRTPMGHQSTPTAEDWELWHTIKARWVEVEKMLADRQALLSTPSGTPGHTQKKTYVFDVRHIALIERYAEDHRLDLKDVLYAALQELFERRGYLTPE